MTSNSPPILTSNAWNERYESQNTPWALSTPTPEFERLVEEKQFLLPGKEVLIPGSGHGHDALLLSRAGLHVSCVEFASLPNQELLARAQKERTPVRVFQRDFFSLAGDGFHQERYDILLEYTFFCAIDPALREKYVETVRQLLKPGGFIVGLFFPMDGRAGGPPFSFTQADITSLFSPHFEVHWEIPKRSVKPREGKEMLGIFKKK